MSPLFVLRFAVRESRGSRGRLVFFCACLVIGTAAVTGISSAVKAFEEGLHSRSRELLGADLAIDGRRAIPEDIDGLIEELAPGSDRVDIREMATLVRPYASRENQAKSVLVELKIVNGKYPLYGRLEVEPDRPLAGLEPEAAFATQDLFDALSLTIGDKILVGGQPFQLFGVILDEPDRLDVTMALGPRLFLSQDGVARTHLLDFGALVKYRTMFRIPGEPSRATLENLRQQLQDRLPRAEFFTFEHHFEAQPTIRELLDRVERYMGLVALLTLILGGIGVAQIIRSWLASRTPDTAVLRCLGMRPRDVLVLFVTHVTIIAALSSLLGASIGSTLPAVLRYGFPGVFGEDLVLAFRMLPFLHGLLLGIFMAVLFSLPVLSSVYGVPPSRVLSHEAAPLPVPLRVQIGFWGALVLGLFSASWIQSGSALEALYFSGGLIGLTVVLFIVARVLMRFAAWIPRERLPSWLVHGVASLARPSAGTTGAVVALGLGVTVVAAISLIERRLEEQIRTALPPDAPSVFFVDVQPDQWDGLRQGLLESKAKHVGSVPVVMARVAAVDGRPAKELLKDADREGGPARWVLTREQRLSAFDDLPDNNRLIKGRWWSETLQPEVSLEEKYANDLGVKLGSVLTYDVQGVRFDVTVTSIRHVDWQSFSINFYVVIPPGLLGQAPYLRFAAARLEKGDEQPFQDWIAVQYPNITMVRVRPLLDKVLGMMDRVALGVKTLGSLTVLAGIVILAGSVSSTARRRSREVALLKTLGVSRAGIVVMFSVEYALSGLLAGVVGGVAAWTLSWYFLENTLQLHAGLSLWVLPVIPLSSAALSVLAGLGASQRALRVRPIHCLRG